MVEMTETAYILHNATENSLVLMDEIGRGTSTFDGLSLAWAVAEELANSVRAFTLFATHYFELTQLAEHDQTVFNVHLDATEYADSLVFLHQVKEGPANQSYGLQVAQLAGVPKSVILKARTKLHELENVNLSVKNEPTTPQHQPELFAQPAYAEEICAQLKTLQLEDISPRKALNILYDLIQLIK